MNYADLIDFLVIRITPFCLILQNYYYYYELYAELIWRF